MQFESFECRVSVSPREAECLVTPESFAEKQAGSLCLFDFFGGTKWVVFCEVAARVSLTNFLNPQTTLKKLVIVQTHG